MYGKDGGKMERWMKVKEDGRRRYRIACPKRFILNVRSLGGGGGVSSTVQ